MIFKYFFKYKTLIFILINSFLLYSGICLISIFLVNDLNRKIKLLKPNVNLVRATYPNYKDFPKDKALKIFEEFAAPGTQYHSFIGYRRNEFAGSTVNIDNFGFRKSFNHQLNNSYWFLGGSTMWGTGSDDMNTIPSIFAKLTNKPVLNLGESSFNSFQEIIQLQILLANGYKPKMVIFYDGVNDGSLFCQRNKFPQLQHSYTSRYSNMIKEIKTLRKNKKERKIIDFKYLGLKFKSFFLKPLEYFQTLDKYKNTKSKKVSTSPLKKIKKKEKYMFCDDKNYAKRASQLTISSWINAYLILRERNIPVKFILQPTASYFPNEYNLEHIIDYKKQAIINERESFIGYYDTLKEQWSIECKKFGICNLFLDLSKVYFNTKDTEIFIDRVHVSPNGNKIIAKKIAQSMGKY